VIPGVPDGSSLGLTVFLKSNQKAKCLIDFDGSLEDIRRLQVALSQNAKGLTCPTHHLVETWGGVNQQPPVHPFRLFKQFWGWTKSTSFSLAQGCFFSASKFSPLTSILPSPSYLHHLISCSLHLQSLKKLPSLSSTNLRGNVRHKAWGRWSAQHWRTWRGEGKRSTSSQMQNWEKKGKFPPFSTFFSSLWFFFSLCFFFFSSTWEEEDVIIFFFQFLFLLKAKKVMTQACHCLFFFLLFFVTNKATTTSLLLSQNFPLLPTSPLSFFVLML